MHTEPPKHNLLQVFCEVAKLAAWGKRVRVPHFHGIDRGGNLEEYLRKLPHRKESNIQNIKNILR